MEVMFQDIAQDFKLLSACGETVTFLSVGEGEVRSLCEGHESFSLQV